MRVGSDFGHTRRDEELADEYFGAAASTTQIASVDVIAGARVRLVYHDPEGGWWFSSDGPEEDEELGSLCLACMINHDPSILRVADLPQNWIARRGSGAGWEREPRPADWGTWEVKEN